MGCVVSGGRPARRLVQLKARAEVVGNLSCCMGDVVLAVNPAHS